MLGRRGEERTYAHDDRQRRRVPVAYLQNLYDSLRRFSGIASTGGRTSCDEPTSRHRFRRSPDEEDPSPRQHSPPSPLPWRSRLRGRPGHQSGAACKTELTDDRRDRLQVALRAERPGRQRDGQVRLEASEERRGEPCRAPQKSCAAERDMAADTLQGGPRRQVVRRGLRQERNDRNAFGKCVSAKASAKDAKQEAATLKASDDLQDGAREHDRVEDRVHHQVRRQEERVRQVRLAARQVGVADGASACGEERGEGGRPSLRVSAVRRRSAPTTRG